MIHYELEIYRKAQIRARYWTPSRIGESYVVVVGVGYLTDIIITVNPMVLLFYVAEPSRT